MNTRYRIEVFDHTTNVLGWRIAGYRADKLEAIYAATEWLKRPDTQDVRVYEETNKEVTLPLCDPSVRLVTMLIRELEDFRKKACHFDGYETVGIGQVCNELTSKLNDVLNEIKSPS